MNPDHDWQRKIKLLTISIEIGEIMPSCPELCLNSHLSILENYVMKNSSRLKCVYIRNGHLRVSTTQGLYEQPIEGPDLVHYERAAEDLLSRILVQFVPDKQSDIFHAKKLEFDTEDEFLYWKKMTILKKKQIMIPEILPDTFLSKIEKYLMLRRGKLYVGRMDTIRDLENHDILNILNTLNTITCTVIYEDVNICQSSIVSSINNMIQLEEMFEKIYSQMGLGNTGLINGKVYFAVGPNEPTYKMMDMHMGTYDSQTQRLGDQPIQQYIEMGRSTLTHFHEYKPFIPDVEHELLYGKQFHDLWLIGSGWTRKILVEFEGIQFGYPAYRMYINDNIVSMIAYKGGRFVDDAGTHIKLST